MTSFDSESAFTLARDVMANSYSPYSGFKVGAVIVTDQNMAFSACNVENAAYPEGTCAEAGAIAAMVSTGQRLIRDIYIMGENSNGRTEALVTPCGGCRQRIREFADTQTRIHLCNPDGSSRTLTVEELLPHSFGPEHLLNSQVPSKDNS